MIRKMVTNTELEQWKYIFEKYKCKLKPNRISGIELLNYLNKKYVLTEIYDKKMLNVICDNIIMNECYKEKLPLNTSPIPKAFYLENIGNGKNVYSFKNIENKELWGDDITRIFIGIDTVTGFCTVEGSTILYDELNAIRGLDEKDLQNYVVVAQYIEALQKFNMLDKVVIE